MLCPFCGAYAREEDVVCPQCAKLLPRGTNRDTGVRAIRQGRRARQEAEHSREAAEEKPAMVNERQGQGRAWVDPETARFADTEVPVFTGAEIYDENGRPVTVDGLDRPRRESYGEAAWDSTVQPSPRRRRKELGGRGTNWWKIGIVLGVLVFLLAIGGVAWLRYSDAGQRYLAAWGMDTVSSAYWQVGEEKMNTGDMTGAIADFERAAAMDAAAGEEAEVNVTGLLLLATCYETLGGENTALAEAIYTDLYTNVVPSAPEAYENEIRVMLASGRQVEAAELMRLAWEKTGSKVFLQERRELLPAQPTVDRTAGNYEYKININLASPEGYEVYYTFDPELPLEEGWTLADGPILLDEGTWKLRAVCVNGDLVSDTLAASYFVSLPSPQQPYAHLAPNTYKKRRTVALSPGVDNRLKPGEDMTKEKDITIYYTIDGSIPNADSPIYSGTPISLGTGWVTLHAIAVNGYGKQSTMLEVQYKIDVKPYPKTAYVTGDTANGVKLNATPWDDFRASFGDPERYEDVNLGNIGACRRFFYPWGFATFTHKDTTMLLVELSFRHTLAGPRNTRVGDTKQDVLSQFRDSGQVASASGNRGLYSTKDGTGKIYRQEDGTEIIRYVAYTADGHYWRLDYNLNASGVVTSIYELFIP